MACVFEETFSKNTRLFAVELVFETNTSYDIAAMRWGKLGIVYLDAGTCDVDLHRNLLWAVPGSLQRGLWYNTACVDIRERLNAFIRASHERVPS